MTWCPSCYQNSCPEAPDITINQTTIEFDGENAYFHDEYFSRAAGTVVEAAVGSGLYKLITLAYTPVSNASVQLTRNALIQRQGIDFIVVGRYIYLTVGAELTDSFQVRSFSASGASAEIADVAAGTMLTYNGTTLEGFLKMDGTTSYLVSAYPTLSAYLVANPDLYVSHDGTNFVLKQLFETVYDTASHAFISIPKWIKT